MHIPTKVSRGATSTIISVNEVITWTPGRISGCSTSLKDVVLMNKPKMECYSLCIQNDSQQP